MVLSTNRIKILHKDRYLAPQKYSSYRRRFYPPRLSAEMPKKEHPSNRDPMDNGKGAVDYGSHEQVGSYSGAFLDSARPCG